MAGNISTGSLLKRASSLQQSAIARANKIQDQIDAEIAYEYSLSSKTYEDFLAFSKHLESRIEKTTDPSKALSLTKAINSARSGYVSNEIQRRTIDVINGRGTNTDKYGKMVDLFYQAADAGNYDLAQSLQLQLGNLSITIQNEQEAAQRVAGTLAMNGVKTLDGLIKKLTKGEEGLELADGTLVKPLALLDSEVKANGETPGGYFKEAFDTVEAIRKVVEEAYYAAGSQEAADKILEKYEDTLDGTKGYVKVAGQSEMLNRQDLQLAYQSAQANNPLYSPAQVRNPHTGKQEWLLQKNKVDDFVWTRDDEGRYEAVEVRAKVLSPYQTLKSKVTNEGYFLGDSGEEGVGIIGELDKNGKPVRVRSKDSASIAERLESMGVTVVKDANGNPVDSNGKFTIALPDGSVVQATIQPDGNIRYFGAPNNYSEGTAGMYEINIFNRDANLEEGSPMFGRQVAPDETSIFGIESNFGGLVSKASDAGINIIKSLSGVSKNNGQLFGPNASISNVNNDFTGTGVAAVGGNLQGSTQILQKAEERQGVLEALQAAENQRLQKAEATRLQAAQAFNLNQTPVQHFAQNGQPIKQLAVRPLPAQPRLTVAAPQPTPRISGVVNATPGRITSVGTAGPQPRLTVR